MWIILLLTRITLKGGELALENRTLKMCSVLYENMLELLVTINILDGKIMKNSCRYFLMCTKFLTHKLQSPAM